MARNTFGGTSADVAERSTGARLPNTRGKVYTSASSTRETTDLLDMSNRKLQALTSDARGMVPMFQGPDGAEQLWVDFNDGKVMLTANNVGVRMNELIGKDANQRVVLHKNGRFTVDQYGNVATPGNIGAGDVIATGTVKAGNVGNARVYSGSQDPKSSGVTPKIGDVWVKFNA